MRSLPRCRKHTALSDYVAVDSTPQNIYRSRNAHNFGLADAARHKSFFLRHPLNEQLGTQLRRRPKATPHTNPACNLPYHPYQPVTMSALQFLNKKSWHTSTIRNNEKVWLAEEAAAKERARVAELQKQLEEERKLEEIQRLEIESGRLDPAEVLKRRRLNWMYEQGGAAGAEEDEPEKKKRREEKERDDVLLGKKKVDLEEVGVEKEKEKQEKAFLVDAEAKFREDPMMQIQRETALAEKVLGKERGRILPKPKITLPARKNKYTPEELAAKKARKEERRLIREERKRRKEEKAMRKRVRAEQYEAKFYDVDVDPHDEADAKLFDSEEPRSADRRRELSPRRDERHRAVSPGRDSTGLSDGVKYGLHIPTCGTGVAVTKDFVPRNRDDTPDVRRSESFREDRPAQPPLSTRRTKSERASRPPLSPVLRGRADEKRRLLKEMKEDALRLEDERRVRAQKHVQDANREREAMDDRFRRRKSSLSVWDEEPAKSFARQTFSRGRSTADRIRQRRAWATSDSNASY